MNYPILSEAKPFKKILKTLSESSSKERLYPTFTILCLMSATL